MWSAPSATCAVEDSMDERRAWAGGRRVLWAATTRAEGECRSLGGILVGVAMVEADLLAMIKVACSEPKLGGG